MKSPFGQICYKIQAAESALDMVHCTWWWSMIDKKRYETHGIMYNMVFFDMQMTPFRSKVIDLMV